MKTTMGAEARPPAAPAPARWCATSSPERSGMWMSRKQTSGLSCWTWDSASAPDFATPTTSISSCSPSSFSRNCRARGSSSTTSARTLPPLMRPPRAAGRPASAASPRSRRPRSGRPAHWPLARRRAVVREAQREPVLVAARLEAQVERPGSRLAAVLEAVLDQRLEHERRHRDREQVGRDADLELERRLVALARDAEVVLDERQLLRQQG